MFYIILMVIYGIITVLATHIGVGFTALFALAGVTAVKSLRFKPLMVLPYLIYLFMSFDTNYFLICFVSLVSLMLCGLFLHFVVSMDKPFRSLLHIGLTSPLIFFVITNFFSWIEMSNVNNPDFLMYTRDFAGLVNCYVMGFPFFLNSLGSTALFTVIFFGTAFAVHRLDVKRIAARS